MLLDQYGKAIKSNKPILEEVAVQTVRDRYSNYPSQGLTPQRLATIFKEADQGDIERQAELFEEMEEKDLHLGGILQTRKLAVTGLNWEILPASGSAEDKEISAAAKEMFEYIENFEDALLDTLDAVGKGFAVQEIMWELAEGRIWVKEVKWIHQRRFTFNAPEALLEFPRLLTDAEPSRGEELLPNKFIVHKYRARSGATVRGGLLRPCSYMYLFKNFDIKDWLIFNELFSVPMRVGKYKSGATPEDKEALKRAVFNLGVDAAAVISDNTLIEILESKLRGDTATFSSLAEYCERGMTKSVLGHTGSSDGTPGKLGNDDQAKLVRQDLLEADAKALQKTVKFQLLKPWVGYNFGPDKGIPIWKLHYEDEGDLEKTAKVISILVKDAGFEGVPEDHIHERFGIPKAEAGQKTLRTPVAQAGPIPTDGASKAQSVNKGCVLVKNTATGEEDWVQLYMERIAPSLQNIRATALDDIEEWLMSLPVPPTQDEFIVKIERFLGSAFVALDRKAITDAIGDIWRFFRGEAGMVELAFGGPDTRAIRFLSKLDNFYISSYLKNPEARSLIKNFIQEQYLEKGAGLFGRGKPEDVEAFQNLLSQKLSDMESWQVRRIVDTSVQRTRNWSSVAQLHEAGIAELEIYEPTHDCAFCVSMNGRVISVPIAHAKMEAQMAMTPEEYEEDLRSLTPSIGNIDAVVEAGMLPPYHPHCHGTVIRRIK